MASEVLLHDRLRIAGDSVLPVGVQLLYLRSRRLVRVHQVVQIVLIHLQGWLARTHTFSQFIDAV